MSNSEGAHARRGLAHSFSFRFWRAARWRGTARPAACVAPHPPACPGAERGCGATPSVAGRCADHMWSALSRITLAVLVAAMHHVRSQQQVAVDAAGGQQPRSQAAQQAASNALGACRDQREDCEDLAGDRLQYCGDDPSTMLLQCAKTCQTCEYRKLVQEAMDCEDTNAECANWAKMGGVCSSSSGSKSSGTHASAHHALTLPLKNTKIFRMIIAACRVREESKVHALRVHDCVRHLRGQADGVPPT